ncbi:MAG: tetratricopeptide repeat protein [Nitrospinae bacterium]|nr:tetratricopeptide repeat protein [Nitrospinota bacterium]MBL7019915.1 tetratricopeptide repeat protein [Nitrospinaceae bacterium]
MAKRLKVSRKDLFKEPDQFLSTSDKAIHYFMDNRSTVIGVITAIVIAGSSFFGFKYYQETRTLRDEAFYFEIARIVDKADGSPSDAKAVWEKMDDGLQKDRASLLLADSHFQNQEYDKAAEIYSTVMNNASPGGINYQMAQVGLAYSYESKADYKKAIGLFKSVIDANTGFPLFEVYWSLSKCHELNNDVSNALLILREMQIKFSGNPQVDRIESRIKQLST